ncbi:hypothetical protein D9M71_482630 [compost metagenome]
MIALHFFIDPLKQVFRQRCVEAHRLTQVRGDIEIHNGPDSAFIVRVRHMDVDFLRLRQRLVICDQSFKMKRQRLLNILQCLGNSGTGGEAAGDIGYGHAVVRIGVLVQYDRKFH